MRIALISDIHANLPALEAVLGAVDAWGADAVYHLGDLVGYAPWPDEVVETLRDRGIQGVAGNYDSTVATRYGHCGCQYPDPRQQALSHESFGWTVERVSEATRRALLALPFHLELRPLGGHATGPRIVLVHATPARNTVYWTEDRDDDFARSMIARAGLRAGDLLAFGHTHLPWQRRVDGVHLVNTGSVGRPKDGDPRAGWVRVTVADDGFEVDVERTAYDVERAADAVRESDLPDYFADYLLAGGAPPDDGADA